ncbi:terminase family protein [Providencia sp. PROV197]|uniref:terminase family protein n=1 Tax=Providencia sp. PROV197 TaxID=2949898 RepID=UPI00234B6887|nr:terminase family protein [Providencia sp. PROV197]
MNIDFSLFDEEIEREIARRSLHEFIQYINPEYITSHFSQTVCDALDQFLVDMMDGKRPKLILGAPPQHGKSDIVSRYLPAYFFGKYPNMRVGALSYSSDLAGDMNTDVQRIMMSAEYRVLFPKSWLGNKPENGISVKRNSDEFGIANHKGSYVCAGVGGPLTGKKVDLGIIDDPIKNSKEALNGSEEVEVLETISGQIYPVKFDRAKEIVLFCRVTVKKATVDAQTIIPAAVESWSNGDIDGEGGLVVGRDVSPFEISASINAVEPRLFITRVELSTDGKAWSSNNYEIKMNEVARLKRSAVQVVLV